jgi:hypothetical protein
LRRILTATVVFSLLSLPCASPALAHGFGQSQDLPVPLWLFLLGASAVVVLHRTDNGILICDA